MSNCRFYDDGHGNGSYIPGASCGPPGCNIGGNQSCKGDIIKCNINKKREEKLLTIINKIKKEF